MNSEPPDRARPRPDAEAQALIADQRRANERLVLSSLRAEEEVERAEAARSHAEHRITESEERERMLSAEVEFREQLIAIVSHDLRNPLQAIRMASELLEATREAPRNSMEVRLLAGILKSGERMNRMITRLLDFTRTRLGSVLPLEIKSANLGRICEGVVAELAMASSRGTVEVKTSLEGDLEGRWDVDRLEQVISNLVSNAIDHAIPDTHVSLAARGEDDCVIVSVTNSGQPISSAILAKIFQPFRGDRTSVMRPGHLGLGLYIARQVVLAHGGTIAATWVPPDQTIFTVRLPRRSTGSGA